MSQLMKAITDPRMNAMVSRGLSPVAGYVVRDADIPDPTPASALHGELGLDFPYSPFAKDAPGVTVIKLPPTGALRLVSPGSDKPADQPPFADHSPFSGTGFVESAAGFVPYWWLHPSPLPAGATLWRIHADGTQQLFAVYTNIAVGWASLNPDNPIPATPIQYAELLGIWATIDGERLLADVNPDGTVVICSPTEREGMERSARGVWWSVIDRARLEALEVVRVDAQWRDTPVQVVALDAGENGVTAHVIYTGHNAFDAERLGLSKTDAGVYESVVPADELTNMAETRTDILATVTN